MEDTGIDMGMQNQLAAGYANTQSKIGRGMIVRLSLALSSLGKRGCVRLLLTSRRWKSLGKQETSALVWNAQN